MKRKSIKTLLEHPNKTRAYYCGEIHNMSATYKSHRLEVPITVQQLADELRRRITFFQLNYDDCNAIIHREFGEGVGEQNFYYHFLDERYGVGFNPREKTLRKYRHLNSFLKEMQKKLALNSEARKVELHTPPAPPKDPNRKSRWTATLSEEEINNPKNKIIELKPKRKTKSTKS